MNSHAAQGNRVKTWHKRMMTIAIVIVAGAAAGWLTLNLLLNFLLGGRTFR